MRSYKKAEITDLEIQNYIKKRITVNQLTGCWEWNLMTRKGYGVTDTGTRAFRYCKTESLHRISYMVFKGSIEASNVVRHRCNNKLCCNPDHLEQGTHAQNVQDKYEAIESMTTSGLQILLQTLPTKIESLKVKMEQIEAELQKRIRQ